MENIKKSRAKKDIGYNQAISEIETILEELSSNDLDIDKLSEKVAKATELISLCKSKLRKAEVSIEAILKDNTVEAENDDFKF